MRFSWFVPLKPQPEFAAAADKAPVHQVLAHAFALAMANRDVRVSIRDAMRASRITEHKVVLQEFITTKSGNLLVRAAAKVTGRTQGAIRRMIADLPRMDFYVPFEKHRLTWTATPAVAVAATMNVDDPHLVAYTPDDERFSLSADSGTPERTIFVIHPAERKSLRINPQPSVPGKLIQEPIDGGLSGSFVWYDEAGNKRITPMAALIARDVSGKVGTMDFCAPGESPPGCEEPPDDPGGGDGSTEPQDTTYLTYFEVFEGDGVGSAEIEYTATFYIDDAVDGICRNDGLSTVSGKLRFEDVDDNQVYLYYGNPLEFVHDEPKQLGECVSVKLVETDAFSDDFWGYSYPIRSDDGGYDNFTRTTCDNVGDPYTDFCEYRDPNEVVHTSEINVYWEY